MNKKVKILFFLDRMKHGGIQQLVLEITKHIDDKKFKIDFLVFNDKKSYKLEEELKKMNISVYKIDGWLSKPFDYFNQARQLNKFFKSHNDYDIIHYHSSSKNYQILKYAKKYNIPIRIAHSHNVNFQTNSKIEILLGNILKLKLMEYATDLYACSQNAAKWLFGKKMMKNKRVEIIENAIDIEKFKFNNDLRIEMRNKLNIKENEIVIGHVGRFTEQKNHIFLIEIFKEIYNRNKNCKLLLIGTGEKEDYIKDKVLEMNIEKNVIFAEYQTEVNKYMQAMDIFVFPSKFEGLGIVLIEAQVNGLICFTSKDVVPDEAKISKNLNFISLDNTANEWASQIINCDMRRDRKVFEDIKGTNYNIVNMIKTLEKIYINKVI